MERGACLRKKGCSCEQLAKGTTSQRKHEEKHTTLPVSLPNSHPPVRARVSPACSGSVSDLGKATLQPPALHQASLCSSLAHASDRGNFHVAFKFPFRDTAHGTRQCRPRGFLEGPPGLATLALSCGTWNHGFKFRLSRVLRTGTEHGCTNCTCRSFCLSVHP